MSETVQTPTTPINHKPQGNPHHDTFLGTKGDAMLEEVKKSLLRMKGKQSWSFYVYPRDMSFETQDPDEDIILVLRKHLITNVPWVFIAFLLILAPLALTYLPLFNLLPGAYQFMTFVVWYLFVLAFVLESFLSWYFNVYIVTDERVVDVDFFSLIYKKVSETKTDKIQDVTYTQGGFLQALFDYGNLHIQTAGKAVEFEFEAVPYPGKLSEIFNQLILQEEQEKMEGRVR